MVRGARRGRQGPTSKPKHEHLHNDRPAPQKKEVRKEAEEDVIYDYQTHTHLKGGRVRGNQVDDIRLTGAKPSRHRPTGDEDDGSSPDDNQMDDILKLNEDGFGVVASDDDEDIDSDEAMGEGDELMPPKKATQKNTAQKVRSTLLTIQVIVGIDAFVELPL